MDSNYQSGGWKKWFWVYIVIAVIVYGGIYLYKRNSSSSGGLYGGSNSPTSSPAPASDGSIVMTKNSPSNGQYLADTNGITLYTFGGDTSGVSNCSASCLVSWPVYTATSASSLPADVTVVIRSDGSKQYAYKGMPLYYFSSDIQAGQVTGDGIGNFHLAKP